MIKFKVYAVVVTYNIDIHNLLKAISTYTEYVDAIVICDNSTIDTLDESFLREYNSKFLYFSMGGNMGIAYALNYGFSIAKRDRAEWVLTMDQDSAFESNLDGYYNAIRDSTWENASILSPVCLYHDKGTKYSGVLTNSMPNVIKKAIQSGCLYRVSDYFEVGPFLNDFFIDYVDYEYCMRVAKYGKVVLKVPTVIMKHKRGTIHVAKVFHLTFKIAKSDPIRHYYQTRNFLVYFKYYRDYSELLSRCLIFTRVLALEDKKFTKIKYTLLGAVDFLRGRFGECIPSLSK